MSHFLSISTALTYLFLGLIAATIVVLLDNRSVRGGVIGSEVIGVIGSYIGWWFSLVVFGPQFFEPNVSSLMLAFTVSMLVVILWRVSARQTFIDNIPQPLRKQRTRYLYVTHHQISRKVDPKKESREFIKSLAFPVSKRDLVHFAETEDVGRETLSLFESLPDHIYENQQQLQKQLKRVTNPTVVP